MQTYSNGASKNSTVLKNEKGAKKPMQNFGNDPTINNSNIPPMNSQIPISNSMNFSNIPMSPVTIPKPVN